MKKSFFKILGISSIFVSLLFSGCGQPAGGGNGNTNNNDNPNGEGTKPTAITGSFDKDSSSENVFKYTDAEGNVYTFTELSEEDVKSVRAARDAEDGEDSENSEEVTTPDTDLDTPASSDGEEGTEEVPPADATNPDDSTDGETSDDTPPTGDAPDSSETATKGGTWTYTKKDQTEPYYSGTYTGNASGTVENKLSLCITKVQGTVVKTPAKFDFAIAATEESTTFSIESMPETVEVAKITELKVETTKPEYKVGDVFDISTLTITAVYDDEAKTEIAISADDVTTEGFDSTNTADEQKVTVSYKVDEETTLSAELTIKINVAKTIKTVEISSEPTKTTYVVGEEFDVTGLELTVTYDDDSSEKITISDISQITLRDFKSSVSSNGAALNVYVSYKDVESESFLSIFVENYVLDSLEWGTQPGKTYLVDSSFDDFTVKAVLKDGEKTKTVNVESSDLTIEGFDSSSIVKDQKVTVTYELNGVTKSLEWTVNISETLIVLDSLTITQKPNKSQYLQGYKEEIDLTGLTVEANYSDGTSKEIEKENLVVSGFNTSTPNSSLEITISYTDSDITQSACFNISVIKPVLSMSLNHEPFFGETLYIRFSTNIPTSILQEFQWTLDDESIYKVDSLNENNELILTFCYEGCIADLRELTLTGTGTVNDVPVTTSSKIQLVRPQTFKEVSSGGIKYKWVIFDAKEDNYNNTTFAFNSVAKDKSGNAVVDEIHVDLSRLTSVKNFRDISRVKEITNSLTTLALPPNLEQLDRDGPNGHTFENFDKLKRVEFTGNKYKTLERRAFYGCDSLESIILPEGMEELTYWALEDCKNLKSITIPKSVKLIDSTFKNSGLEEIIFAEGSNLEEIKGSPFSNTNLKSIKIPKSVKKVDIGECEALEEVLIEESDEILTFITKALYGCKNLTKMDFATRPLELDQCSISETGIKSIPADNKIYILLGGGSGDKPTFNTITDTELILPEIRKITGWVLDSSVPVTKVVLGKYLEESDSYVFSCKESINKEKNENITEVRIEDHEGDSKYNPVDFFGRLPNLETIYYGKGFDGSIECEPDGQQAIKLSIPEGVKYVKLYMSKGNYEELHLPKGTTWEIVDNSRTNKEPIKTINVDDYDEKTILEPLKEFYEQKHYVILKNLSMD